MVKRFTVKGEPFGKRRPRFRVINGKYAQAYSPTENVLHEREIQMEYMEQCNGYKFPDNSEIYILIDCYNGVPKSVSKTKRSQMLCYQIRPRRKPDWDNIGKTICDSLNNIAFHDDSMIVDGRVRKYYGDEGRVEITITDNETEYIELFDQKEV